VVEAQIVATRISHEPQLVLIQTVVIGCTCRRVKHAVFEDERQICFLENLKRECEPNLFGELLICVAGAFEKIWMSVDGLLENLRPQYSHSNSFELSIFEN